MRIKYGVLDNKIDVTQIVYDKLQRGNFLCIPNNDVYRNSFFSDPLPGVLKSVFISTDSENFMY